MSEKNKAYEHEAEIPGTQPVDEVGPSKEDVVSEEGSKAAYGNAETRNELTPDQRGRTDGYGPRTHDDTRITRKDAERGG